MKKLCLLAVLWGIYPNAHAEYCAMGPIKATECSGVVFQSCQTYELAYLENSKGRFEPAACYSSVDEYSRKNNSCVKKVYDSGGLNPPGYAVDKVSLPAFYGFDKKDQLKKIEPSYITFPCRKN